MITFIKTGNSHLLWVEPCWAVASVVLQYHMRVRLLNFKLGLKGIYLYIRRGGVSLEGKQEE
jgi:hypothetical protein